MSNIYLVLTREGQIQEQTTAPAEGQYLKSLIVDESDVDAVAMAKIELQQFFASNAGGLE